MAETATASTVRIPETDLPRVTDRVIETPAGTAIGHSARWEGGQYCALITRKGLIGCGAYHVPTMEHEDRGGEPPGAGARRAGG
jgi:hypothetical protein